MLAIASGADKDNKKGEGTCSRYVSLVHSRADIHIYLYLLCALV